MDFAGLATQELTVSGGSSLDVKEQVRQAIDIVDLVGSHIQLRRQGRSYVGLCPWHDDTRPSLQVNPERQSFKCWVCDIGGDVFSFVMKIEGVEFREALEMLADRAGVSLQRPRRPARSRAEGASEEAEAPLPVSGEGKRTLYKAMAWAESQYHHCLLESPEAEPARRYLEQRAVTGESIEAFHLGFSPTQRDWILGRAGGDPQRAKVLETVGLLARPREGGDYYDRFKGRLLFSIRDPQGRPVGLGGRVLPELGPTSPAKYVNSPETPLFSKSHLLYGLDVAREAIRKSRTALVMEGYTDVIVAHQYGFSDAVAALGTALGEGHVRILKRFADRIVLVLDGDEAGQRRANEVLELFVAQQVDLRIVTLPEATDPCDFLQRHGAEAFQHLLETEAVDALNHAFRVATGGLDLERDTGERTLASRLDQDVHGASQALDRLLSILAKAPQIGVREQKILQQLAARFRVDELTVRRRLASLRRSRGRTSQAPREQSPGVEAGEVPPQRIDPCQRELLEILIRHPECLPGLRAAIDPRQIAPQPCRQIYETCCRLSDAGITPGFERLMLEFDDPAIKSLLVELDERGRAKGERDVDAAALSRALVETLKRKEAERQRAGRIVTLREGGLDDSQETELLEKIIRQERSRQGISKPTDG
jgi:DNA primase